MVILDNGGCKFMYLLYFLVSLIASIIGGICGIGGGVIIKPVLDATGTMSVTNISFLSGCTVLSMSIISVLKSHKNNKTIDVRTSTLLAIGGIIGGILGKSLFDILKTIFNNENYLGAVQAALLIIITVGTLIYSIYSYKIKTKNLTNIMVCLFIGLFLGMVSSFLGIGGGPINLTVLFFFFSMDIKKAAANSLYIIMFSQLASLFQTIINKKVPSVSPVVLALMVAAGVVGGIIGGNVNKKISEHVVDKLFIGLMIVIIGINIFNVIKFVIA